MVMAPQQFRPFQADRAIAQRRSFSAASHDSDVLSHELQCVSCGAGSMSRACPGSRPGPHILYHVQPNGQSRRRTPANALISGPNLGEVEKITSGKPLRQTNSERQAFSLEPGMMPRTSFGPLLGGRRRSNKKILETT